MNNSYDITDSDLLVVGSPEVDMFATVHNTQLPCSCFQILQHWQGWLMYLFPPFSLLNKVIQKLGSTQTSEIILITHWRPFQPWFPHLVQPASTSPVPPRPVVSTKLHLEREVIPSEGSHAAFPRSRIFRRDL